MTHLKDLSVTVTRQRTCHCCGHELPVDIEQVGGVCEGCFAKITPLGNGRVGYRVKAAALTAMPPHETVQ